MPLPTRLLTREELSYDSPLYISAFKHDDNKNATGILFGILKPCMGHVQLLWLPHVELTREALFN